MACCTFTDDGEQLLRWLNSAIGQELTLKEQQCVENLCSDLFGCYMLQLGWGCIFNTPTAKSLIKQHIVVEECVTLMGGTKKILGKLYCMPILSDSIDVVFMPHTLEFATDPTQILREVDRVLIPGGHLIILGFNIWSFWGIYKLFLYRNCSIPWCGKFISSKWVTHWLITHGFHIEYKSSILFLPPLRQTYLLHRLRRIEPMLKHYLPANGAVYVIKATKREMAVIPPEIINTCETKPHIVPAFSPTACKDKASLTSASGYSNV
jgi:SAM-dependent methyltransferase